MSYVLMTIAFLSFIVFLIALLVNTIRKKAIKTWVICLAASVVIFFIGAATAPKTSQEIQTPIVNGIAPTSLFASITPPFISLDQQETEFKTSTSTVNLTDLCKLPVNYLGQKITFTGTVLSFMKDSSGNAEGINVNGAGDYSSVVVVYLSVTDLAQINKGDSITVWGEGASVITGSNALGGTITVPSVEEWYLINGTNGYSSGTVKTAYLANDGNNKVISTTGVPQNNWGICVPGPIDPSIVKNGNIHVWVNTGAQAVPIWTPQSVGIGGLDSLNDVNCTFDYINETITFGVAPPNIINAVAIQYSFLR